MEVHMDSLNEFWQNFDENEETEDNEENEEKNVKSTKSTNVQKNELQVWTPLFALVIYFHPCSILSHDP